MYRITQWATNPGSIAHGALKQEPTTIAMITAASAAVGAGTALYSAVKGTKKPKESRLPSVTPKVAPVIDNKGAQRKQERDTARRYGSQGRLSTVMSEGSGLG